MPDAKGHKRGEIDELDPVLLAGNFGGIGKCHGLGFAVTGELAGDEKFDAETGGGVAEIFAA
jgi:hypothetical protein